MKELASIIGKDSHEKLTNAKTNLEEIQALKQCYSSLMNSGEETVAIALKQYEQRLCSLGKPKTYNQVIKN